VIPRLAYPPANQSLRLPNTVNKFGEPSSGLAARVLVSRDLKSPTRRTHNDVIDRNIGWGIEPEKWAKRAVASHKLAEQSAQIANALERMGIKSRLDSDITESPRVCWRPFELSYAAMSGCSSMA
jgi:hypothetical protein